MKKNPVRALLLFLIPFLFFTACATIPGDANPDAGVPKKIIIPADSSSPDELFWNTLPDGNSPLFFGMSSRHGKRETEAASALEDAAKQASRYLFATGKVESVNRKSGTGTGFAQQVSIDYDQSDIEGLSGRLTVLKEYQDSKGTYIVAQFDAALPRSISCSLKKTEGEPNWVTKLPQIPGYFVSIGIAQTKRLLADSIKAADEQAFADAIRQVNTEIKLLDKERTIDRLGTQVSTTGLETASGNIAGFYVISRGLSADGKYYYSLAVCPESNFRK
jgi:hypothetical protein